MPECLVEGCKIFRGEVRHLRDRGPFPQRSRETEKVGEEPVHPGVHLRGSRVDVGQGSRVGKTPGRVGVFCSASTQAPGTRLLPFPVKTGEQGSYKSSES